MKPPVFNAAWPDDVKALYQHDIEEIWDKSLVPHIWNQYHNQIDTYTAVVGCGSLDILDVGCAQATLAITLAEQGHRVTAVDIRPHFLEYAQSRHTSGDVRFVKANVLEDEIPGTYDLIFANQIIEHLVYPKTLVARLKALLRPGGRLVVTTPNCDYLVSHLPSYRELGNPADWEHMQFTADGDGHFYAYLSSELEQVFEQAGMRQVHVRFFETPWISGHMKVRYLHGWCPVSWLKLLDKVTLRSELLARRFSHQLMIQGVREA